MTANPINLTKTLLLGGIDLLFCSCTDKMRKNVDSLFMLKTTLEVIYFILIILELVAMESYSGNKVYN